METMKIKIVTFLPSYLRMEPSVDVRRKTRKSQKKKKKIATQFYKEAPSG